VCGDGLDDGEAAKSATARRMGRWRTRHRRGGRRRRMRRRLWEVRAAAAGGAREGEMRAAAAGRREGGGDASGGRRQHVEMGVQAPSTYGGSPPGPGFYRVRYRVPLQPVQELGPANFTGSGWDTGCRCGQPNEGYSTTVFGFPVKISSNRAL
jgi:hypothetical protein